MIIGRVEDRNASINFKEKQLEQKINKILHIEKEISYMVIKDGDEYKLNPRLDVFKDKFTSEHISILENIISNMNAIDKVAQNEAKISLVSTMEDNIANVLKDIEAIKKVEKAIPEIENFKQDMCISVERAKNFYLRGKDNVDAINKIYSQNIYPEVTKLNTDLVDLKDRITQDIIDIEAGHAQAIKWMNYDIQILLEPMCYECSTFIEFVDGPIVDGKPTGTIYFHIPKPICVNSVSASVDIVKDSVDAYLKQLALLTQADEDVTVDDLEDKIEPSWGYKLDILVNGLIDNSIIVRSDSNAGGIILSRADNTGMSKDDMSWFKLRGYNKDGTLVSLSELSLTYLSTMKLTTILPEVSFIMMSFKRVENSNNNDLENIKIAFLNNKWRVKND